MPTWTEPISKEDHRIFSEILTSLGLGEKVIIHVKPDLDEKILLCNFHRTQAFAEDIWLKFQAEIMKRFVPSVTKDWEDLFNSKVFIIAKFLDEIIPLSDLEIARRDGYRALQVRAIRNFLHP